ncbi:PilZ domain-containing protein [Tsuneonella sp. SYSU-LHT278]|uniref:PilZ domain-containing protein n=1 Tax=Tsuneonella sediminis TaxID=3416089 RepID=UPI003F793D41
MSGVDTRHVNRDSLFLMAELQLEGESVAHRVRVRNLSACGMMAEGDLRVLAGARVTVNLRNLRPVEGSVAWVHERRFGIAFAEEIDPKAPRSPVKTQDTAAPRFIRPSSLVPAGFETDPKRLRNI